MTDQNTNKEAQDKKKKRGLIILFIVLAAILVSGVMAVIFWDTNPDGDVQPTQSETRRTLDDEGEGIEGDPEKMSHEELLEYLKSQQIMVTDNLSSSMAFASGDKGTVGEWTVQNIEDNAVIMQAEVYIGKLMIAKTAPIYPGQYVQNVELLEDVADGSQKVLAYINYYHTDSKEYISRAGYEIMLEVKN